MNFYKEHQNVASYSKYPFADGCSLLDEAGHRLSDGFLLDASLCLHISDVPYLSSLSSGVGVFSASEGAVAEFRYDGPGVFQVFELSSGLQAGLVVLGPSASGIEESRFSSGAAMLCPACFCLFKPDTSLVSISCDVGSETVELRGNVRLCGKNGVYVTKTAVDTFQIDIIGQPKSQSCCENPLNSFTVVNLNCPAVSGALVSQVISGASNATTVPGVLALYSPLSAESVCNRKERYIDDAGNIGLDYCKRPEDKVSDPCQDYTETAMLVVPSQGTIDFIPYYSSDGGASPVYVRAIHPTGVSSFTSKLQDPSLKNLALAENSGSVVIGFRGNV